MIYRLPVRLRYKLKAQMVEWSYDIYRDDNAFKAAYDEVGAEIETKTGKKVYTGSPK